MDSPCLLTDFKSANRKLPFLPTIRSDGSASMDSPLQVFTNPSCTVLGFDVVASSAREFAVSTLKVPFDPPSEQLVAALLKNPSKDVATAQRCFEVGVILAPLLRCRTESYRFCHRQYLGAKVSNFTNSALDSLTWSAIVPVQDPQSKTIVLKSPKDVYLTDGTQETSGKGYRSLWGSSSSLRSRAVMLTLETPAGSLLSTLGRVRTSSSDLWESRTSRHRRMSLLSSSTSLNTS